MSLLNVVWCSGGGLKTDRPLIHDSPTVCGCVFVSFSATITVYAYSGQVEVAGLKISVSNVSLTPDDN
jgi:hypothetical protein